MSKIARVMLAVAIVAAATLLLTAGCSSQSSGTADNNSDSSQPREYSIEISRNDQHVTDVTLTQLHALPSVSFAANEKTQTGPTLLSVLQLAGITEFSKVTVSGLSKGRVASAELPLEKSQINDQVILEFNNQGKTKLAAPTIPDSKWIIDVDAIEVE